MGSLHVTSEIGRLESVLVHTPGPELKAVTPTNRADYLYDDIIALEIAQREHRRFVSVLQRFAEVWQVSDLLAEVLEQGEAREFLTTRTLAVVPSEPLARRLASLPPREIVRLLIEGEQEEAGSPGQGAQQRRVHAATASQSLLPRDIGMVIGSTPWLEPCGTGCGGPRSY
jgi:arginine deiminase